MHIHQVQAPCSHKRDIACRRCSWAIAYLFLFDGFNKSLQDVQARDQADDFVAFIDDWDNAEFFLVKDNQTFAKFGVGTDRDDFSGVGDFR